MEWEAVVNVVVRGGGGVCVGTPETIGTVQTTGDFAGSIETSNWLVCEM